MNKSRQELIEAARQKLQDSRLSNEQLESLAQMLDLMAGMAGKGLKGANSAIHPNDHDTLLGIIQQQAAEFDALKRITHNLASNLELRGLFDVVVAEAMRLINGASDAQIFLYTDGQLTFGASFNSKGVRNQLFAMPRPEGLTYTVARAKEILVVDDVLNHPLFSKSTFKTHGSMVGIPLMKGDMVVGVMNMSRFSAGGFTPAELRLLGLLADQAAIAVINARLHLAVSNQAFSDTLTGLPNRRALDARLEDEVKRSARYNRSFAVLMMDLDGFKAINDTWGHVYGDQVLGELSKHMNKSLRSTDFLARYGGDEMTMIIPEADVDSASKVGEKIRERVSLFEIALPGGARNKLGISGGIALYPAHGRTASALLRAADEALYRAKKHSRGSFVIAHEGTGELRMPKPLK